MKTFFSLPFIRIAPVASISPFECHDDHRNRCSHCCQAALPLELPCRAQQPLLDAGIAPLVGITGDSCDNALSESNNAFYKAEMLRPHGGFNGSVAQQAENRGLRDVILGSEYLKQRLTDLKAEVGPLIEALVVAFEWGNGRDRRYTYEC